MDLHDFGSLIWAVFILIAVISSVMRSARRTASSARQQQQSRQAAPQRPAPQPRPAIAPAPLPRVLVPPAVPPIVRVVSESAQRVVEKATTGERASVAKRGGTAAPPRRSSVFGKGDAMKRGIIALEVLGPPRALRDWSAGFPN